MDEGWSSGEESGSGLSDDALREQFAAGRLAGKARPHPDVDSRPRGQLLPAALEAKRADIGIADKLEWAQTFLITSPALGTDLDINDDFSREGSFYNRTIKAIEKAQGLLKKAKIAYQRPQDYYAEMVKTDEHMGRIKKKLLTEKQQIEASEQARKMRLQKKFGKKVQQEVLEKRQRSKKQALEQVARHRKGLQSRVAQAGGDEAMFDVSATPDQPRQAREPRSAGGGGINHRREAKNSRYGTGGHRNKKSNSKESYTDTRQFSLAKNRTPFAAGKKKPASAGGPKRAGKANRQKARANTGKKRK